MISIDPLIKIQLSFRHIAHIFLIVFQISLFEWIGDCLTGRDAQAGLIAVFAAAQPSDIMIAQRDHRISAGMPIDDVKERVILGCRPGVGDVAREQDG